MYRGREGATPLVSEDASVTLSLYRVAFFVPMAQRRMMSDKVIKTDSFMEMPHSTKNLYFYLMMEADDDGFVSNPKTVMRMIGAAEDDYKILIGKRFVIPFESGICVIKHWLIHNLIRADRKIDTQWAEEMKLLVIDDDTKKYSLDKGLQPSDNQVTTKCPHRLGKVRLGKVKQPSSSSDDGFSVFWNNYPKKIGKGNAEKSWSKMKPPLDEVLTAIEAQKNTEQWSKDNGQFIPHPATWLNQKRWQDEVTDDKVKTIIL